MFREVARTGDILPGGMKAYEVDGKEIVLCNDGGRFYAFDRRCGHMSAPLDMGTVNGYILTCPLHAVQFDVTTGEALSGPVSLYGGGLPEQKTRENLGRWIEFLMEHVRTRDIRTYPVKVDGDRISVDV
ncbi:MAG TPA: Rieske 2Fe-2S domain-containing protein [Methanocella sp.]|nr:Rieske 2Fe-2S domain-containing protein [Methanocella sp.]